MKFGKLENIENVDFNLPRDNFINEQFFSTIKNKAGTSTVYSGATSWINENWKGVIFPQKTKKADFLLHYSSQFNSIELNATHYRTPSDKSIISWKESTPKDFKFCPKILQAISHRNDMISNKTLVNEFIVQISKLEEKLGYCFIQLPPYFKYGNLPYLESFLKFWPQELGLAIELRDEEIHQNKFYFEKYIELLTKHNCVPLITDVAGRRDLLHMVVNSNKVFIRWVGNGLHHTDYERIKQWTERIAFWTSKGVDTLYFMVHEPENEKTPEIAEFLSMELENFQYIGHRGPKIIKESPNLFS